MYSVKAYSWSNDFRPGRLGDMESMCGLALDSRYTLYRPILQHPTSLGHSQSKMDPPPYTSEHLEKRGQEELSSPERRLDFSLQKRRQDFSFRDGFINLDQHGAPAYPREVLEAKFACYTEFEECQELFTEQNHEKLLLEAHNLIAADISCSPDDIVIMRNINEATFLAARTGRGRFTICLTGGEINAGIRYMKKGGSHRFNVLNYVELSIEELRAKIIEILSKTSNHFIEVVVFLVPAGPVQTQNLHTIIQELRNGDLECRFKIIDVNGIGLTNFRVDKDFPSMYVASTESWCYSGNPCAFLYTPKPDRIFVHGFLIRSFEAPELLDYANICALTAAKQYIDTIGGFAAVQTYQNTLAASAHRYLLTEWKQLPRETKMDGTADATRSQFPSPIFFVKCPFQPEPGQQTSFIAFMKDRLREEYDILMAFVVLWGNVQIRFSAAIYLDLHDFEVARAAVDESIGYWQATSTELRNLIQAQDTTHTPPNPAP